MDKEAMKLNNDEQSNTFPKEKADEIRKLVKKIQYEVKEELNKSKENKDKTNETSGRSR